MKTIRKPSRMCRTQNLDRNSYLQFVAASFPNPLCASRSIFSSWHWCSCDASSSPQSIIRSAAALNGHRLIWFMDCDVMGWLRQVMENGTLGQSDYSLFAEKLVPSSSRRREFVLENYFTNLFVQRLINVLYICHLVAFIFCMEQYNQLKLIRQFNIHAHITSKSRYSTCIQRVHSSYTLLPIKSH